MCPVLGAEMGAVIRPQAAVKNRKNAVILTSSLQAVSQPASQLQVAGQHLTQPGHDDAPGHGRDKRTQRLDVHL